MRIVSLLPSATEIVVALGHEADLVGRSAECDYPPRIRDRAVVMAPRVRDSDRPSAEIDRRVRRSRENGESLYVLDTHALARLKPELLLTQDLCGVCSVTREEVAEACRDAGIDPKIVSLTPHSLLEVWDSIRDVGNALEDVRAADRLVEHLEQQVGRRPETPLGPRVTVVEWLDPPIVAGLWVADMIEAAGGTPIAPASGSPGVGASWSQIEEGLPALVILSPCSFSVDRTRREIDRAGLDRTLARLRPDRGIWLADEAYFSRPGPRLADGVDLLRAKLWSEPYTPPMPARPWVPLEV